MATARHTRRRWRRARSCNASRPVRATRVVSHHPESREPGAGQGYPGGVSRVEPAVYFRSRLSRAARNPCAARHSRGCRGSPSHPSRRPDRAGRVPGADRGPDVHRSARRPLVVPRNRIRGAVHPHHHHAGPAVPRGGCRDGRSDPPQSLARPTWRHPRRGRHQAAHQPGRRDHQRRIARAWPDATGDHRRGARAGPQRQRPLGRAVVSREPDRLRHRRSRSSGATSRTTCSPCRRYPPRWVCCRACWSCSS